MVLVFDPSTGALLGEEYAYCNAPVEAHLATGKCFATSYDQFLQVTAVQSIPATPTPAPDTPPSGPVSRVRRQALAGSGAVSQSLSAGMPHSSALPLPVSLCHHS